MSRWFAVMPMLVGCDGVFGLTRLQPPPDAAADAPVDASPDAPTILDCATSPIIIRPTGISSAAWMDQYPATGTHADHVSEAVADEDQSYIASAADAQVDLFTHLPVADNVTIDSVTIWARARIEGTIASAQLGLAFTTSARIEWDDVYVGSAWGDHSSATYPTSPATSQRWTVAEVNAMPFGVRKAYSTERARVTQVWASVVCR